MRPFSPTFVVVCDETWQAIEKTFTAQALPEKAGTLAAFEVLS